MNERLGSCCLLYRCYAVELVVSSCSRKNFRSSHEKCSSKKLFFKILQILHCVGVTLFKITLYEGVILFQTGNILQWRLYKIVQKSCLEPVFGKAHCVDLALREVHCGNPPSPSLCLRGDKLSKK